MKSWRKRIAVMLAGLMLLTPVQTMAAGWEAQPYEGQELQKAFYPAGCSQEEWEVLALTNKARIARGQDPLTTFPKILEAANVRAREQSVLFGHQRPNGSQYYTALDEAGVFYSYSYGENAAVGFGTPSDVMNGWMNSTTGHRENILESSYDHLGMGYYQTNTGYRTHWIQLFIGICSFRNLQVLNANNLTVKKGTSLENMGLACAVNCSSHGTSYFPLDASFCSGYNPNDTSGKPQTVTVRALGQTTTFQVTVGKKSEKPGDTRLRVTGRTTSTVTVAWDRVPEAEGYTVWYRSEYDNKVKRKIFNGNSETDWRLSGLQPGTKYFFTVRAWVDNGTGDKHNYLFGDESPVQRGTTKPERAEIKQLVQKGNKVQVKLEGAAKGAEMYSICYANSITDFASGKFKVSIRTRYTTRTMPEPTLQYGRIFYVCVKSYRELGNNKRIYGDWSNLWRVTVNER